MTEASYSVRQGGRIRESDLPKVLTVLTAIERDGATDVEEQFVERSRSEDSPTHHLFEWDDAKAAHLHRVATARSIICAIEVTFDNAPGPVRAFPCVVIGDGRSYMRAERVYSSDDLRDQLVAQAKRDAESWYRKHEAVRKVAELFPVFDEIERAVPSLLAGMPSKASKRDASPPASSPDPSSARVPRGNRRSTEPRDDRGRSAPPRG